MVAAADPRVLRTRELVLDAARELFLAEGLAALTHLELARRSGVGRKTIYRHWPTTDDLVHDTLAAVDFPHAARTGDLEQDLRAHLEVLRRALVDGPLAYVIHALGERAAIQPELDAVRRRLVDEGCAPVREILRDGIGQGVLPDDLDVEFAAARLEGPLFYRSLVQGKPIDREVVDQAVEEFLATAGPR